jgi:hypothetical protein
MCRHIFRELQDIVFDIFARFPRNCHFQEVLDTAWRLGGGIVFLNDGEVCIQVLGRTAHCFTASCIDSISSGLLRSFEGFTLLGSRILELSPGFCGFTRTRMK